MTRLRKTFTGREDTISKWNNNLPLIGSFIYPLSKEIRVGDLIVVIPL